MTLLEDKTEVLEKYNSALNLPKGWLWTNLEAICNITMGQSPPSETYNDQEEGLPFFQGKTEFGPLYPVPVKWCSSPGKIAEKNDILISVRAPVGPTNIAKEKSCIGRGLAAIKPLCNIPTFYLFYCLRFFENDLAGKATGTTFAAISGDILRKQRIPLAPLAEQERIVAEIEKQFTRLDAAIASLRGTQARLKRYKASVLKAACEGRLVPQDPNDEPASVLLERILKERRDKWEADLRAKGKDPSKVKYEEPAAPDTRGLSQLPQRWAYTFLQPLLLTTRKGMVTGPFGSLLKKHEHQSEGIPVLGIENIEAMKFIAGSKIHITEKKAQELANYLVRADDILISRSGTVGEVCVVPNHVGIACISTNLMKISLATNGLLPEFFCILFNGSPLVLHQVSELCSGSTRDFLSQEILKTIFFPIPPLAEQKRILAEVERRLSVVAEFEAAVEANLKRAERLRQSILKKAFSGRLVPQDPNDEPALLLLERIRAERAAQKVVSENSSKTKNARSGRKSNSTKAGKPATIQQARAEIEDRQITGQSRLPGM